MTCITVQPDTTPGSPTAGIQEAIDALPATGGTVHIAAGEYVVRHSIRLRPKVTLRGDGGGTVLRRPPTVMFDLVSKTPVGKVAAEVSSAEGLRRGDEVYLRDPAQGGWNARHLTVTAIGANRIEGILVFGDPECNYAPSKGGMCGNFFPMLFIDHADDVTIESLTIDGSPHPVSRKTMPGFTCSAVHGISAVNLRIHQVTVRNWPADGISAQKGTATVTHCLVENCIGHGYHPGTSIAKSIWSNNVGHSNGGDGFFFCQGVRNAVVSDNIFSENAGSGIGNLSEPDAYNAVIGNIIFGNGRHGIEGFSALGNVIANNLIRDNSTSAPGKYAAIYLECHRNNSLTGNAVFSTVSPATQTRAIELIEPTGDNCVGDNLGTVTQIDSIVEPPPQIAVVRTTTAPAMDGNLGTPAWQQAEEILLDKKVNDGSPADTTSSARLLHDGTHLYIGVHCNEPLMDQITANATENGGPVWADDCIEIYLQPNPDDSLCFQFAVNSLGFLFEKLWNGSSPDGWQSRARAAATRNQDSWSVTLAIPLDYLPHAPIPTGGPFRMNVYRTRLTVSPEERSGIAPTRAMFLLPSRFPTLTLKS